ncbi:MAG: hypothetical protein QNJ31_01295 [Candidatus Caenarcaniphilales bacterium]|nr:hypothetical protein [Candidatus Caenarcaniphilales bacterium]
MFQVINPTLASIVNFPQSTQTSKVKQASSLQFTSSGNKLGVRTLYVNPKRVQSEALSTSLFSTLQALGEIFLGFAENTGISMVFVLNSAVEFLGASLLSIDSFFRRIGLNFNLHIDKLMALVQTSIAGLIVAELIMKFKGSQRILKNIDFINKLSSKSKTVAQKIAKGLGLPVNKLLNIAKVGFGASSLLLALKKSTLSQNMIDPQQRSGFLSSALIDVLCSLETLLLFIPEENAFADIIEKIYLAFSSSKLLSEAIPKIFGKGN